MNTTKQSTQEDAATTVPPLRKRLPQIVRRFLLACVVVYAVIILTLCFEQRQLIFAGSSLQGDPAALIKPEPGLEPITLHTARGDTFVALFGSSQTSDGNPDPNAAHRPTLIYFYGSGDCLNYSQPRIEQLRRLGANVLMPEFVGYGASGGTATEANCYATADAAYEYLRHRPGVDPNKIILSGISLGAASAIDLASRKPVAGLITLMAFTSMAEMGSRQYPIVPFVLSRAIVKHRFLNEQKMPRVHCPILIIHGRADTFVPYSMSDRLAKAAGGPVTRLAVEGAGHVNLFDVGRKTIYPAMETFLKEIK